MKRYIKRFGGSLGVIIGKYECQINNLKEGDLVEVKIKIIKKNGAGRSIRNIGEE